MVLDGDRTVTDVARECGIHDTTLGNWVRVCRHRHDAEETRSLSGPERARLRGLERQSRELREKVQFPKSRGLLRE
ncbi:hypothetical protein GCM10010517_79500 [Streptosporangium fragile]|uniref:Transposase n=1 Tax=Streptosporangium fragile TaxID=46186 RepID=A0ABN3WH46_9ACTN